LSFLGGSQGFNLSHCNIPNENINNINEMNNNQNNSNHYPQQNSNYSHNSSQGSQFNQNNNNQIYNNNPIYNNIINQNEQQNIINEKPPQNNDGENNLEQNKNSILRSHNQRNNLSQNNQINQDNNENNSNNNNIVPQNVANTPIDKKLEENELFNGNINPFTGETVVKTEIVPPKNIEDNKNNNQLSLIKEKDENEGNDPFNVKEIETVVQDNQPVQGNQPINTDPFNVKEIETVVQDNQPVQVNQPINTDPLNVKEIETVVQDNQPVQVNQPINNEPFNIAESETVVQDNQPVQVNQPINNEPFNIAESETVVQENQPIINQEPFGVEESETIIQDNKIIDYNPFADTPEENTILDPNYNQSENQNNNNQRDSLDNKLNNLENNDPFGNLEETGTIISFNKINKPEHIPKKENQIIEIKEEKNEEENNNIFDIAQYDVEYKMDNSDMIEKENDTGIIPVPLMSDIIRRDYLGNAFHNIISIPDIDSQESGRLRSRPHKKETDKEKIAENQQKIFNLLNSDKTNNSSINNNSEKSGFDSIQNSGNFNIVTNPDNNK
jgi:hypothetical protein